MCFTKFFVFFFFLQIQQMLQLSLNVVEFLLSFNVYQAQLKTL